LALLLWVPGANAKVRRSFWGVQIAGTTSRDFHKMHRARVGTVRLGLYQAEIGSSSFNWSASDHIIGNLASRGIRSLPILLASQSNPPPPIGSASARKNWKAFVHHVVARYKPGGRYWHGPYHAQHPGAKPKPVKYWQVFNEPSLPKYFPTSSPVKDYARLLNLSHDAIRSASRHARIVLAGLPGVVVDRPYRGWKYLNRLYRVKGVKHNFDIAAFHPYSHHVRDLSSQMRKFRRVMKRHGDKHAQVWITEFGYGSGKRNGRLNFGLKGQARMLKRSFRLMLHKRKRWNLHGVIWYDWRDPAIRNPDCSFCSTAGLLRANFRAKPALRAFEHFSH
jgi:hypothetical protein